MKAWSSPARWVYYYCAESLALYLCACSLDNSIRWPWSCTSSIRVACYRNVPFLSHKTYKIETVGYYRLFETDSSIHVFSVWTLKHHIVTTESASWRNIWSKYNSRLSNGLLHCPHRRTDCIFPSDISSYNPANYGKCEMECLYWQFVTFVSICQRKSRHSEWSVGRNIL